MGYDVHITRKTEWFDKAGPAISLDEWLRYVAGDSEMRSDGFAEATTSAGETVRLDDPGIAVWTAYSGHGIDGNMAWFCHFQDRVTVKNPDAEIRRKMHGISSALGAHVQGDEGEEYGADGEALAGPTTPNPDDAARIKPWWRLW